MISKIILSGVLIPVAFVLGWFLHSPQKPEPVKRQYVEAFPQNMPLNCVEPNTEELKAFEAIKASLKYSVSGAGFLEIGAEQTLASGIYRVMEGGSKSVCTPKNYYESISEIVSKRQLLTRGRLEEYSLKFAEKITTPPPSLVNVVAASAFAESHQPHEFFHEKDIRPYARTVLATFGNAANKFSEKAFLEMNSTDAMGTGAAQIAVATNHPGALQKTKVLMEQLLSSEPKDSVIPWNKRNRLYELAYAIHFGGDEAKNFSAPVRELMQRKVSSFAMQFGMLPHDPKRMCYVLSKIEGASATEKFPYCSDDKVSIEH